MLSRSQFLFKTPVKTAPSVTNKCIFIRFASPTTSNSIPTSYFGSTFKSNIGELAVRSHITTSPSKILINDHKKKIATITKKNIPNNSNKPKTEIIEIVAGLGKNPTTLSLLKATHAAMRKARALEVEHITLAVPQQHHISITHGDISLSQGLFVLPPSTSRSRSHHEKKKNKDGSPTIPTISHIQQWQYLSQFAEMGGYEWNDMKTATATSSKNNKNNNKEALLAKLNYKANINFKLPAPSSHSSSSEFPSQVEQAINTGRMIGKGVNTARTFGNIRPNVAGGTDYFAKMMISEAKKLPNVNVVDHLRGEQLRKKGLNLFYSVGKAAIQAKSPPNLVILEYIGDRASKDTTMMIGKGLVHDSGGMNVKPYGAMETMHQDKNGAAAVYGAFVTAARLKLKTNFVCAIGLANNAIGETAYTPSEIIKSLKGSTVEVTNTDAEGRLVLADAMTYGQKFAKTKKKVTNLIDVATLTGAICVALGNDRAGVFSNDYQQMKQLISASGTALEPVWPMPIGPEHHAAMKGLQSDLTNCATGRYGGASSAAAFLSNFVEPDIKWSHLDIAGPALGTKGTSRNPDGATGFGTNLLVNYLMQQEEQQQEQKQKQKQEGKNKKKKTILNKKKMLKKKK